MGWGCKHALPTNKFVGRAPQFCHIKEAFRHKILAGGLFYWGSTEFKVDQECNSHFLCIL